MFGFGFVHTSSRDQTVAPIQRGPDTAPMDEVAADVRPTRQDTFGHPRNDDAPHGSSEEFDRDACGADEVSRQAGRHRTPEKKLQLDRPLPAFTHTERECPITLALNIGSLGSERSGFRRAFDNAG